MNMSPKPTANANRLFRCTYSRQSCITQTPSSIKTFLLEITDESKKCFIIVAIEQYFFYFCR